MSDLFHDVVGAALDAAEAQAEALSAEYQQKLSDMRAHATALLDDVAVGAVSLEDAEKAAGQEVNALKSLLLAGALDAEAKAQGAALDVVLSVLKVLLAAAV